MIHHRTLALTGVLAAGVLLAGCAMLTDAVGGLADEPDTAGEWVVVTYGGTHEEFSLETMDALLPWELTADEALQRSGLGHIDGNEVGDHGYQLFFVGGDARRLWQALEPVLAGAPVPWTRVELFASLDDEPVQVVLPR